MVGKQNAVSISYPANLSDTEPLTNGACGALLVGTAGNVKVTYRKNEPDGDPVTDTVYLAAGVWHLMDVLQVWSTGTTATGVHVGY